MKNFRFARHRTGPIQQHVLRPFSAALAALAIAAVALAQGQAQPVAADFGSTTTPGDGIVAPLFDPAQGGAYGSSGDLLADGASSELDLQQQQVIVDVAARDDFFEPAVVTITVGSAVRWTNRGTHVHTTTSDNGFWNWALVPGSSYGVRFLSAGTYDYHCTLHMDEGMRGRVVVLPAQGGATPPTPGPTATPRGTPMPGEFPGEGAIVYDYFNDEAARDQSELFVVDADGGAPRQLTFSPDRWEVQPNWAPDRRSVAFAERSGLGPSGPWNIRVLNLETGMTRDLTTGPLDLEPDWHPTGAWVAYTHIEQGAGTRRSEIRAIREDGTDLRVLVRLDSTTGVVADPSWSPDGQSVVFTVSGALGGTLYRWQPGRVEALTANRFANDIDPAWSPNGRYVAFASGRPQGASTDTRHDIWLLDMVTGGVGAVAAHPTWDLRRPAWSPDGTRLVFNARFERGPDRWALYTVPATGGTVSGPLAMGTEPDWGAGERIALPTPMPGPTGTPPPPPVFPTPIQPPTPFPTATEGPPPTFPPPPVEPTPTSMATATETLPGPTATATAEPTTSVSMEWIYLPLALRSAPIAGANGASAE